MKKRFRIATFLYLCIAPFSVLSGQPKIDSLLALLEKDKEDTNKVNHLNALARELSADNIDTSILLSTQALQCSQKQNWKKGAANSSIWLGGSRYLQGDYRKALDCDFYALKIGEEIKNKKIISSSLGSIGLVYKEQADYPKALEYYFKALKMYEELGSKNYQAIALGNIGVVYMEQASAAK